MTTISISRGRFFSQEELETKARLIVLGANVAQTLFGTSDPIGQTVTIGKETLTVIGVTKTPKTASLLGGNDYGAITILPIDTAGDITGGVKVMRILVKIIDSADVRSVIPEIEATLLERHTTEDFSVLTQEDMLGLLDKVLDLLTNAIIAIAAISLVVAGVGIMNIMLVAVTERTGEIGLRKAVGATNSAILIQFLLEALVLTIIGAIIALALSIISTQIISRVTTLHPVVTSQAIAWAIGVAALVGIVFGLAPALRAARLDPIKALRYE